MALCLLRPVVSYYSSFATGKSYLASIHRTWYGVVEVRVLPSSVSIAVGTLMKTECRILQSMLPALLVLLYRKYVTLWPFCAVLY